MSLLMKKFAVLILFLFLVGCAFSKLCFYNGCSSGSYTHYFLTDSEAALLQAMEFTEFSW